MDFRTLGLPPGSDWEDVKSAFRRLARTYHPDVAGPEHSRRFAEITRAYMSLKESIQAPSVGVPSRPVERPRTSRGRRGTSGTPWWDPGRFVGRLQRLWRSGRASFARRRPAEDTQRSPARDRFVEEALDRAEMHFRQILGRRVAAREDGNAPQLLLAPADDASVQGRYALRYGSQERSVQPAESEASVETQETPVATEAPAEPVVAAKRPPAKAATPANPQAKPYAKDLSPANEVEKKYQDLLKQYRITN